MKPEIVMFVPESSSTEVFSVQEDRQPDFDRIENGLAEQIGRNLRIVRSNLRLSQQTLAERIGISLSQYRKYEAGRDLPRLHAALLWSIETGIPTHWLFKNTGYQHWLNVPFRSDWIPFLSFINAAPDWALATFQSALTGVLNCYEATPALESVHEERARIDRDIFQMDYYQAVAEQLRQFRVSIGVSQDDAAQYMGISTEAYRRYETPNRCTHFSINLIMRFWVATNTNPLALSSETPVFLYRMKQRRNLSVLLPLLERLDTTQHKRLTDLMAVIESLQVATGDAGQIGAGPLAQVGGTSRSTGC